MKYYFLTAAMLLFVSCGGISSRVHEESDSIVESGHSHEGGITLSVEQASELGLEYMKVESGDFSGVIRTSGLIEPSTADNSSVSATSSGVIRISHSDLNVGMSVSKGGVLFTINSEGLTGDNLATKAKIARSELDKAEATYSRAQKLFKDNLTTEGAVDEARAAVSSARETYNMLSQSTVIVSPQSGYVTSLDVKNGDYVSQGQPLATISSGRQLVLRADVTARYFDKIADIMSANFTTPYNGKSYSVAELGGRLLSRGAVTSAGTYAVPVRFAIDNRAGLVPGSSVEVFLITSPIKEAFSVPVSALTEEQGAYYVYLKTCKDSYKKQPVTLGESNGIRVRVLTGLSTGDVVVTRGAYFVRLAGMSSSIPHGHEH